MSLEDLKRLTEYLENVAEDLNLLSLLPLEDQIRLKKAAGKIVHPDKLDIEKRNKANRRARQIKKQEANRSIRAATEIRSVRSQSVFIAPPLRLLGLDKKETLQEIVGRLENPRACYVCKTEFYDLHFFYDSMCLDCARFNYSKRFQTASLKGRVALITGARMKIGYHAALMMLRAGARVIVTTRFPQDSALRYAREDDFHQWKNRLQIYGLDLRHSPSVEVFSRHIIENYDRLDILINNAAQTVRRPPEFYAHMMPTETLEFEKLPVACQALLRRHQACKDRFSGRADSKWVSEWHVGHANPALGLLASAQLSQIPYQCDEGIVNAEQFPQGKLDADLQQVDLRAVNSWRMKLADVPTAEMLEVHLVNAVAPFILCAKLKPLMMQDSTFQKHIVNVSAMEGKFSRHTKTDKHPHTNMAKAALNMMTLTSARDYAQDGIYMNAVDTGWVTDEDTAALSEAKQKMHDFQPPLDIVDGAARICDPFFSGLISGQHSWGNFLKDYRPTTW